MARNLDREAYGQVERTLGELQSQLSRKSDDLAFYKSIVSPEDGVQGLRIHRFRGAPGAEPREFVLKLTLVQAMRHDSVAHGLADLVLHGTEGGRPARHSLGELLGRRRRSCRSPSATSRPSEQAVTLPEARRLRGRGAGAIGKAAQARCSIPTLGSRPRRPPLDHASAVVRFDPRGRGPMEQRAMNAANEATDVTEAPVLIFTILPRSRSAS